MIDFAANRIDALLVSSLPNVRYLSGFTGSNAMVLLQPDSLTLFTDPRYTIQAAEEAEGAKLPAKVVIAKKHLWQAAVEAIKRKRLKRIGFEETKLTFDSYSSLKEALAGRILRPRGTLIEDLRTVKTEDEIARIRRAVQTNSKAFEAVTKRLKPGTSEQQIAAGLDYQMRRLGAEGTAFETIVASGVRSALPHARPTDRKLGTDELLLIDMGAAQDGYMSDMTRTLFLAKPGSRIRSMYDAVLDAQLAAIAAVREGVSTNQVDAAARNVLRKANLEREFVHSTGHGLGLEIHEAPRIGKKDKTRLKAGMVITIEPGAYVEGVGGVRIEDTVLVTKTGCEVLTPTPKELMIL